MHARHGAPRRAPSVNSTSFATFKKSLHNLRTSHRTVLVPGPHYPHRIEQRGFLRCSAGSNAEKYPLPQWIQQRQARGGGEPLEARLLSGFLSMSATPYSSFLPEPRTVLHAVDARIKEVWIMAVLLLLARASAPMRAGIALGCAVLTMLALPPRLWRAQLGRLGLLTLAMFVLTAIGADGVPPVTQARIPSAIMQGLPACQLATPYRYVLLHLWVITITRRSVNLAITSAALTFTALQSASLVLTTTPPEELALGLSSLLTPLRLIGAPVKEIGLTLLLSLRFLALAFDESRNMALGLAARNINWKTLGTFGGLQLLLGLGSRLFSNLFQRSDSIAVAMTSRGFVKAEQHQVYLATGRRSSWVANVLALTALGVCSAGVYFVK